MRVRVPEAQSASGPISGKISVRFQPNASSQVQLLSDRMYRPYPASDLHDPDAMLLVREADEASPQVIPRTQWSFAKLEDGKVVPDASHVYMASGFVAGKLYQVVYSTTGAPVIGLGLLTTRDITAFLRYGTAQEGNPCAGGVQQAYAFGASQSGRYLRQFLYLGLNEDEQERLVFDGLIVHVAGGKRGGDFNQRFGQPSSTLKPSMSDLFPFTDTVQTDPRGWAYGRHAASLQWMRTGTSEAGFACLTSACRWRRIRDGMDAILRWVPQTKSSACRRRLPASARASLTLSAAPDPGVNRGRKGFPLPAPACAGAPDVDVGRSSQWSETTDDTRVCNHQTTRVPSGAAQQCSPPGGRCGCASSSGASDLVTPCDFSGAQSGDRFAIGTQGSQRLGRPHSRLLRRFSLGGVAGRCRPSSLGYAPGQLPPQRGCGIGPQVIIGPHQLVSCLPPGPIQG
jgi:hypothetical protein